MTEWNADEYTRIPELQAAMAEEALALLNLAGSEHVLYQMDITLAPLSATSTPDSFPR